MGTWTQVVSTSSSDPNYLGSSGQCSPISDGRLMVVHPTSGAHGYLTPDLYGNYTSWSGWYPSAYDQKGATMMVLSDGRCLIIGGHAGQSGEYVIKVVDPTTNSVSYLLGQPISHQGRGTAQYLDDGRIVIPRGGSAHEVFIDQNLNITIGTAVLQTVEADMPIIPDGRLLGFGQWPGTSFLNMYEPNYSTEYTIQGSYPGTGTGTSKSPNPNVDIVYKPGVTNTRWMYGPDANGPDSWGSDRNTAGTGASEIGGQIYMPMINKVVVVGAWGGEIFGVDPELFSLGKVQVLATTPNDTWTVDDNRVDTTYFTLGAQHNGQSISQIVSSGVLNLTASKTFTSYILANEFCVQTIDGWTILRGTSNNIPTTGTISAGSTFQMSGVYIYRGQTSSNVVNQSKVYWGNPNRTSVESWIGILPSGKLIYPAGFTSLSSGGYTYGVSCDMYIWDGASTVSIKQSQPVGMPNPINYPAETHGCIAPNGTLVMAGLGGVYQYQEDSPQNTQYAPTITSVPTNLQRGRTYTLSGRQLSGRHIGFIHGDDWGGHSNIGLVKLVAGNGFTYWARTKNWTYRGIAANRASSMEFTIPNDIPDDNYRLYAVSCGISSDPVTVTVGGSGGESIFFARY